MGNHPRQEGYEIDAFWALSSNRKRFRSKVSPSDPSSGAGSYFFLDADFFHTFRRITLAINQASCR